MSRHRGRGFGNWLFFFHDSGAAATDAFRFGGFDAISGKHTIFDFGVFYFKYVYQCADWVGASSDGRLDEEIPGNQGSGV